ncbi:G-type lectin S-receptor-like serine/threonine-protein kinase [Glycine max]|nr:G-type lectin S-receptor-like serine/threonine-protein kinase [Glycine max]
MAEEFVNGFVHQNGITTIPAPCPQVAEDEFLPQHIHLSIFRYGRRICEWLCSSKRHGCHNPQSPQRRFWLHARKLLRTSFYRNTFTSVFFAMAEEFLNGFVHQNGIVVITHNPPKGDGEKKTKIWIILVVVVGLICLGIHIFLVWRFMRKPKAFGYNNNSEIPVFDVTRSTDLSEISGELGLEGNQLNFSYILADY